MDPSATVCGGRNPYQRLKIPTCIRKIGDTYFICDCYHNQIIYSPSLNIPLTEWKVLDNTLQLGHTIAGDGTVYLADDTENHSVLVYEQIGEEFQKTQMFSDVGERPHYIVYDQPTKRFYALSSMTGELYVFKRLKHSSVVVLEEIRSIEKLRNRYVRSFTIIDDEIYFVSGAASVIRARLSDLSILEEYPVGAELDGMVQLEKIQDWYYITISTDASGNQDAAAMIRTQHLEQLLSGNYEKVYDLFGNGGGTPYYMGSFDGHWYLTEHRKKNRGIWEFDVLDNELKNIHVIY